ncbi:MAG: lipopolysaccharide biosynthesis protein [Deltaproteobacteria bacterium RBG_19FT_COMBO_43_11]|nr:MAG: lipopolysaccharide biosynthesis protein [Deltaproteobacteria bacterium RBG_16_44_11]OGP91458.1 MAG: lipopolysaccharide biosynthesis protein [Deltaproteobacteria bacterium RBG_19FT_COMBO_43_11]
MNLHPQLKNYNFYLMIVSDAFIFVVALVAAHLLRFEFSFAAVKIEGIKLLLLWIIPLKSFVFLSLGLYRGMWRYTSIRDLWLLAKASLLSSLLILAVILYVSRFEGYSRAVFIADGVFTFLLTGGLRVGIRFFYANRTYSPAVKNKPAKINCKNVLIIGAGYAGEKLLRELLDNYQSQYKVLGFIDDDPKKQGRSIHGVRVLGGVSDIAGIVERKEAMEIFIAIPSAEGAQIRNIVETCVDCNISYKILPAIDELVDGQIGVNILRDISYEDILGRTPVHLDISGISNYLAGKTILITGCGGSIGSELCRQVIRYQPASLVLLDASEINLFTINMELQNEKYYRNCEAVLGNVQDKKLMNEVFKKYRPQVVFHAAAYKHVPMLERNPWEAVFNNIIGSRMAMELSIKHDVERFVLVSTDKAVRPANVMGASKRVTELIMQSLQGNGTRLMAVRFGNVIGSSGSVVPIFQRQIQLGGPVTVTHPKVSRYFMTIPEAAQMILQAGAMGAGGEIFILRMGKPVKIDDMARDLIRIFKKVPDVDVKITYIGLREGEKLHEELIVKGEDILPTVHEKVVALRSNNLLKGKRQHQKAGKILEAQINELVKDALRHDANAIKKKLKEIVPEYTPQNTE